MPHQVIKPFGQTPSDTQTRNLSVVFLLALALAWPASAQQPSTDPAAQRMNVNLEYAQGVGDSRGVYLKLGYAW